MHRRVILSGSIVEVWEYSKLTLNQGGARAGTGEYREANYQQRQAIRRAAIRRLVNANFSTGDLWVTLTLADNVSSLQEANHLFGRFTTRLRRRYPGCKYIAVPEFQKRGAVHYHMVLAGPPAIPNALMAEIWGHGFTRVQRIRGIDNIGAYLTKYLSKESADKRLAGKHGYLASRNLERPQTTQTWGGLADTHPELRQARDNAVNRCVASVDGLTPVYTAQWESAHAGSVSYREYNILRPQGGRPPQATTDVPTPSDDAGASHAGSGATRGTDASESTVTSVAG